MGAVALFHRDEVPLSLLPGTPDPGHFCLFCSLLWCRTYLKGLDRSGKHREKGKSQVLTVRKSVLDFCRNIQTYMHGA